MTIVFDDEELYTALKVAAMKTHRRAKDIVAEALHLIFEATAEEHDTILTRSRMKGTVPHGLTQMENILEQLGLAKDRPLEVRAR